MSKEQQPEVGRRGFLGALGGMAGAAVAVIAAAPAAQAQQETPDEMRKARYQESDHVKTFYRVNGYETK